MKYELNVAGLTRDLPICKVSEDVYIGAFIMFGDVELTCECAKHLLSKVPEFDLIVSPEAKAIPLVHEMCKQCGMNDYVIVRKNKKAYMKDVFEVDDKSITTEGVQKLYIDKSDSDKISGKRILIVDDVISTGGSIAAVEHLVKLAGGTVVGRSAVLAEGDASLRDDIIFLESLPLFDPTGTPKIRGI